MQVVIDISEDLYIKASMGILGSFGDVIMNGIPFPKEYGMTKEQKVAIEAMMYAFDNYGAQKLVTSSYIPDFMNHPEYRMNFGEAYNICAKMIREESEVTK